MSATNSTTNLNLPKYIGTDKPTYLGDWNDTMDAIDTAVSSISAGNAANFVYITATHNNVAAYTKRELMALDISSYVDDALDYVCLAMCQDDEYGFWHNNIKIQQNIHLQSEI